MLSEAHDVLSDDPVMATLVDEHDIELDHDYAPYERLCISIINQQLSTASATAVRERVYEHLGEVTPGTVLGADEDSLRDAGLSGQKVEYMQRAARAFQEQDFSPSGLAGCSNDEVIDRLTEIKGIGTWTAQMYLIFVLQRPDVLPLGDLAVRRGIEACYAAGAELSREEMRAIAESWCPYRSVGTRYIWAEYES
jgi:DNA-3-methyladenine glycosylase II